MSPLPKLNIKMEIKDFNEDENNLNSALIETLFTECRAREILDIHNIHLFSRPDFSLDYYVTPFHNSLLTEVVFKRDFVFAKRLIELEADIDARDRRGFTCLMSTILKREVNVDVFNFLIRRGADTKATITNDFGKTRTVIELAEHFNKPNEVIEALRNRRPLREELEMITLE